VPTLNFSPSFRPHGPQSTGTTDVASIRISAQTCSAIVLALNAYQGAFTSTHLQRLKQQRRDAVTTGELAPLIAAVERAGAVHVSFETEGRAARHRR